VILNPVFVTMTGPLLKRTIRKGTSYVFFQPPGASEALRVTKSFLVEYIDSMIKDKEWLVFRVLNREKTTHRSAYVDKKWVQKPVVINQWTVTSCGVQNPDDFDYWDNLFQTEPKVFQLYVPFLPKELIATLAVKHDSFGTSRPMLELLKGM